ncbi:LacI family transcriptional regulator [Jiangella aurantiaca]|uniref:LacI family transcriptional regulator n=1 Tax=Jiangella aurantiaca TaxID=2530373 RepID=A0A4R5A0V6_9ACTN|nr:LacI family DNA-binding transcriptional regulator [Jiangella aurantiaca]TDD65408.1 LacI family transcriptional regulator [Jiangella aurantiaca]
MSQARQRVSMRTVAERAGVSIATVSYVLSARREVAPSTRRRVERAIDELGYVPNQVARSMRTQRTDTVALIVPSILNPFYPAVARGLQDVLEPQGSYGIVVCTDGDPGTERRMIEQMVARRVDGIGLSSYLHRGRPFEAAVEAGIPVVLLGSHAPEPGVDAVGPDDVGGGRRAVQYLLERDRRRIGFITGPQGEGPAASRVSGYLAALRDAAVPAADDLVVRADFSREGGREGMRRLLDLAAPPDAVICTNDVVAIGALDVLRELSVRVPQDVAVVGFDDIEAATLVSPALTTIANPARQIGQAVARILLQRMAEDEPQPPQAIAFGTHLIQRESA